MPRIPSLRLEDGMVVSVMLQFIYTTYFVREKVQTFRLELNCFSPEMQSAMLKHLCLMVNGKNNRVHRVNVDGADIAFTVEDQDGKFLFSRVPFDEDAPLIPQRPRLASNNGKQKARRAHRA